MSSEKIKSNGDEKIEVKHEWAGEKEFQVMLEELIIKRILKEEVN
ncbi:hypothetical protein [Alkaliphilus peptidifermentans]|uniref:Uncharacterized protein n=1 Tax=Alkaliphilus peptidifermentans DSM 18978 TaxID=1120976 RepID=A0A1G5BE70_9FIRM|nr:hypothetical protein [Alkaliphilus peptidifermentans]SCX88428.1 hypothetical protein SAMN03080606_00387 [Alkaliphilus peptidifermentans DSM 18978]